MLKHPIQNQLVRIREAGQSHSRILNLTDVGLAIEGSITKGSLEKKVHFCTKERINQESCVQKMTPQAWP